MNLIRLVAYAKGFLREDGVCPSLLLLLHGSRRRPKYSN